MGRPRKPLRSSGLRGFESHSFRSQVLRDGLGMTAITVPYAEAGLDLADVAARLLDPTPIRPADTVVEPLIQAVPAL